MSHPKLHSQFFSEIVEENEGDIERAIQVRPLEMINTVILEAADHAVFDWLDEHVPDHTGTSLTTKAEMSELRYHEAAFGKESFTLIVEATLDPLSEERNFRLFVRIEADRSYVERVL